MTPDEDSISLPAVGLLLLMILCVFIVLDSTVRSECDAKDEFGLYKYPNSFMCATKDGKREVVEKPIQKPAENYEYLEGGFVGR